MATDAIVVLLHEHGATVALVLEDERPCAPPESDGRASADIESFSRRRAIFKRVCVMYGEAAKLSTPKFLRCAGCHRARYCSQACQKAPWKNRHREACTCDAGLAPAARELCTCGSCGTAAA